MQTQHNFLSLAVLLWIRFCNAWWQPSTSTTWQIILSDASAVHPPWPSVTAIDADLFDVTASQWTSLKTAGHKSICYFSAGSWENWRPDKSNFNPADIGKPLAGWPGERWLNVTSPNVRQVMQQRLDSAKQKGCDAVDPDNMDAYQNGGGGFDLTTADAVNYIQFIASEAHSRGMACGLKNALSIVPKVVHDVDFAVNEQCVQYQECNDLLPFTNNNKPVFGIEYPKPLITQVKVDSVCDSKQRPKDFETLIKYMNLNATYWACPVDASSLKTTNATGTGGTSPPPPTGSPMPNQSSANHVTRVGLIWSVGLLLLSCATLL